ncbi:hypothetical protein SAMN05444166_3751 [Singulisphaera sp. GP187]|nr:hypothetical protein SAMN05444166_3751 [Singulisphaera sp. GP187]
MCNGPPKIFDTVASLPGFPPGSINPFVGATVSNEPAHAKAQRQGVHAPCLPADEEPPVIVLLTRRLVCGRLAGTRRLLFNTTVFAFVDEGTLSADRMAFAS